MIKVSNLILGAGIAGLAAGQHLFEKKKDYIIIEQNEHVGGLCASFEIEGFTFDHFIHLSFTNNLFVRKYFDVIPYSVHIPDPQNYYHGIWIKHPAVNNLFPLSQGEKNLILESLSKRDMYSKKCSLNYEYWLRYQFGDYFAEHFPLVYTKKYWIEEAKNMETKWIGNRVYHPAIEEIKEGMHTADTPITYYAKEMRYPKRGGYGEFLKPFTNLEHIQLNEEITSINLRDKIVTTDKNEYHYINLYNSIPLPELLNIIQGDEIEDFGIFYTAVKKLHWTSGYIVSLGLQGKIPRKDLWDYIYDEDIFVSRYYSPSQMSCNSAPENCYSIQAEVYTRDGSAHQLAPDDLRDEVIEQLDRIGAVYKNDIIIKDIRFRKYCNILFDKDIYVNRNIALNFLKRNGVVSIGRFGEWAYYWSDQSFISGFRAVHFGG